MHTLKRLPYFWQQQIRNYVKKTSKELNNSKNKMINERNDLVVHQETLRYIHPFARINIYSDIRVQLQPSDVHEHPNGNAFIAQLLGGGHTVKNTPAKLTVKVCENDRVVDVEITKTDAATNTAGEFLCDIRVPIRADLHIESQHAAHIASMYNDEITVVAHKDIHVKDLHSKKIRLCSENGNIEGKGFILGKCTEIETRQAGHITLDKLQGDDLRCYTNSGDISTSSCYVEHSKFDTKTGNLHLKNVHKKTEVHIEESGDLNMTGVHGNLYVHTSGGNLNLQLSELEGENVIVGENVRNAQINISDTIEENTYVEVTSNPITLDKSMKHLEECLTPDKQTFKLSNERDNDHKLLIAIKGGVQLGKLSWTESLMATMNMSNNNN